MEVVFQVCRKFTRDQLSTDFLLTKLLDSAGALVRINVEPEMLPDVTQFPSPLCGSSRLFTNRVTDRVADNRT